MQWEFGKEFVAWTGLGIRVLCVLIISLISTTNNLADSVPKQGGHASGEASIFSYQ